MLAINLSILCWISLVDASIAASSPRSDGGWCTPIGWVPRNGKRRAERLGRTRI
ncbi:uncharacterized protein BO87DRAFT_374110 [Aspergillus neoniger CBS 115656]|uniref:Uncharacterized protein n=1 Tax=Aspergillus neoniger (strain CBS 115656) TaxID=1448310 RepID=A0A318ZMD8_ASPNB|nr:hypothetical protein BO87DRAFT_374110 [Aspergillus neoniger CBS 115656]PYH37062.1 hypothetical protein BO87DRAFT_374110 [Aspergillus neoniger CBS 115656]